MSKDYTFHYLGIVFPSWPFLLHGIALDTVNCLSLAVTMVTPLFAKNRVTFGQPRTTYPKYRDICVCVSVCKRKVEKHIETSSETKSWSWLYKVYFFQGEINWVIYNASWTPHLGVTGLSVRAACKRRCPLDTLTLEERYSFSYETVALLL